MTIKKVLKILNFSNIIFFLFLTVLSNINGAFLYVLLGHRPRPYYDHSSNLVFNVLDNFYTKLAALGLFVFLPISILTIILNFVLKIDEKYRFTILIIATILLFFLLSYVDIFGYNEWWMD